MGRRARYYRRHHRALRPHPVLYLLLALIAAGSYLGYQQRFGAPGESLVDRWRALPLAVDFDALDPSQTPASVKSRYSRLNLVCTHESGKQQIDYACRAPIESINGVGAKTVTFFFMEEQLTALRVVIVPQGHPQLFDQLERMYGQYSTLRLKGDFFGADVVGWVRPSGVVAINDRAEEDQEAVVVWAGGPAVSAQQPPARAAVVAEPSATPASRAGVEKKTAAKLRMDNWINYRSDRLGVRLRYPRESSAPMRSVGADAEHIILRRLAPGSDDVEFVVDVHVYEHGSDRRLQEPCEHMLGNASRIERGGKVIYVGIPRDGTSAPGRQARGLCLSGPSTDFYVWAEAQDAHLATIEAILDSLVSSF